jgi:hypothetical protein
MTCIYVTLHLSHCTAHPVGLKGQSKLALICVHNLT